MFDYLKALLCEDLYKCTFAHLFIVVLCHTHTTLSISSSKCAFIRFACISMCSKKSYLFAAQCITHKCDIIFIGHDQNYCFVYMKQNVKQMMSYVARWKIENKTEIKGQKLMIRMYLSVTHVIKVAGYDKSLVFHAITDRRHIVEQFKYLERQAFNLKWYNFQ